MANIQYQYGDIFESKAHVIVNTVNCKGVMGKGLALAFKQRYPEMFPVYQQECKSGKLRIGKPTLYRKSTPWILNFPTKDNWKANSKIEYLEKGLEYFVSSYKEAGIASIAFPKLGAQNGKLSWDEVGPLMAKYLADLDIDIYIYIAEGDTQYFPPDSHILERIWQRFNEIALSSNQLQIEIKLSKPQSKKVFEARQNIEFKSFSDVCSIDGLAKISCQRIKEFINHQLYTTNELPGITSNTEKELPARNNKKTEKSSSKTKSKRTSVRADGPARQSLFLFS